LKNNGKSNNNSNKQTTVAITCSSMTTIAPQAMTRD